MDYSQLIYLIAQLFIPVSAVIPIFTVLRPLTPLQTLAVMYCMGLCFYMGRYSASGEEQPHVPPAMGEVGCNMSGDERKIARKDIVKEKGGYVSRHSRIGESELRTPIQGKPVTSPRTSVLSTKHIGSASNLSSSNKLLCSLRTCGRIAQNGHSSSRPHTPSLKHFGSAIRVSPATKRLASPSISDRGSEDGYILVSEGLKGTRSLTMMEWVKDQQSVQSGSRKTSEEEDCWAGEEDSEDWEAENEDEEVFEDGGSEAMVDEKALEDDTLMGIMLQFVK